MVKRAEFKAMMHFNCSAVTLLPCLVPDDRYRQRMRLFYQLKRHITSKTMNYIVAAVFLNRLDYCLLVYRGQQSVSDIAA